MVTDHAHYGTKSDVIAVRSFGRIWGDYMTLNTCEQVQAEARLNIIW